MIHLRTILAASTVATLCTILVNCGGNEGNDDNPSTNTATDSGTDGPFVADGADDVGDSGAQDAQDCTSCYRNNETNAGCLDGYTSNQCPCSCFTSGSSNALASCGPSGCRCVDNENDSSQSCVAANDVLGDAGPVFSASCSGSVTTAPLHFDWTYAVTDQGSISQAQVTLTGVNFEASCSGNGTFTNSLEPLDARDKVVFPCVSPDLSATWSMALNRATMVVYIAAQGASGPPLSWTPNCH